MRSDDFMTPATKADINAIVDEFNRYTKAKEALKQKISDVVTYTILALLNLAALSFLIVAIVASATK
jgi:hypothetical protein